MNSSSPSDSGKSKPWHSKLEIPTLSDDPTHPAQVALRTYALSLSLSLGPSLIPFITSLVAGRKSHRTGLHALQRVLRRELGYDGFAFAVTLSVAGGRVIQELWHHLDGAGIEQTSGNSKQRFWRFREIYRMLGAWAHGLSLSPVQKTFISNVFASYIGVVLLQAGRHRAFRMRKAIVSQVSTIPFTPPISYGSTNPQILETSPTLDLTLLLLVRAVDAAVQNAFRGTEFWHENSGDITQNAAEPKLVREKLLKEKARQQWKRRHHKLTSRLDAFVFWACSARSVDSSPIIY